MGLSSGLVLSDLSDYLAPSQICIKPVEQVSPPNEVDDGAESRNGRGGAATEIQMEDVMEVDGQGIEVKRAGAESPSNGSPGKKAGKKLQKAQITLNDCLACSGCITSAESVLVSLQSHTELILTLEAHPSLVPIMSIAPQSLGSLAALHGLSPRMTLRGLRQFFKREFGFRLVFDTTFAREVGLLEAQREFDERQQLAAAAKQAPLDKGKSKAKDESPLPLLASACPGWICYAEKTHGALLPFISRVKSPQQIQGSLVKSAFVGGRLGLEPRAIYHVAVMMCYDKKLEASRPDFAVEGAGKNDESTPGARDVDCVLTTGEVQKLLDERGWDLRRAAMESVDDGAAEAGFVPELLEGRGSASGGYLHNVMRGVTMSIPKSDWPRLQLAIDPKRGQDYVDYTLSLAPSDPSSHASPTPIFKGAQCYGFRNLQNLVRKIGREQGLSLIRGAAGFAPPTASGVSSGASTPTGRGKSASAMAAAARRAARKKPGVGIVGGMDSGTVSPAEPAMDRPYDYVEVMACPSGCVNGGGQVPPPLSKDTEGMPIVENGEWTDGGVEVKMVGGVDADEKPVAIRSAKEWVELVERIYWSKDKKSGAMDASAPLPEGIVQLHPSMLPLVVPVAQSVEGAAKWVIQEMEAAGKRDKYLRTGYRAVESEEVNGLAVKW